MEAINRRQLPSADANKKSGKAFISGHRYSIRATADGFQLTANDKQESKSRLKLSGDTRVVLLPPAIQNEFKLLIFSYFPNLADPIPVGSHTESITKHYFKNLDSKGGLL